MSAVSLFRSESARARSVLIWLKLSPSRPISSPERTSTCCPRAPCATFSEASVSLRMGLMMPEAKTVPIKTAARKPAPAAMAIARFTRSMNISSERLSSRLFSSISTQAITFPSISTWRAPSSQASGTTTPTGRFCVGRRVTPSPLTNPLIPRISPGSEPHGCFINGDSSPVRRMDAR